MTMSGWRFGGKGRGLGGGSIGHHFLRIAGKLADPRWLPGTAGGAWPVVSGSLVDGRE